MSVAALVCPNCGAPLTLVGDRCKFCQVPLQLTGPSGEPIPTAGPPAVPHGSFSMQIEDVFTIARRGTVVTGRIATGSVRVGDALRIDGPSGPQETTCSGVELFGKKTDEATMGDNVGLLLKDVRKGTVAAGDWVLAR